jgi:hypothetical protein
LASFFVPDVDAVRHFRPFRAVVAAPYSFGIIPTLLVRVQCCGSAGSPATSDRPTARSGLANQSKQSSGDDAAAKPAVPDGKADTSEKARQGNLRLWDAATTCAFFGNIDISTL